ncbi:hypothetical protein DFH09DRAFT_1414180 [Mycena vulgaris]|nr:hypothetical protein DFH09DRAFT_1414180 [Mycena vulgaris]
MSAHSTPFPIPFPFAPLCTRSKRLLCGPINNDSLFHLGSVFPNPSSARTHSFPLTSSSYTMKATRIKKNQNVRNAVASTSMLDTSCRIVQVTYHTNSAAPKTEERYRGGKTRLTRPPSPAPVPDIDMNEGGAPLPFQDAPHEEPGASPAYDLTVPLEPEEAGKRRSVDSMEQFKAKQDDLLKILLSLHSSRQVNTPCSCPEKGARTVACQDCVQAPVLCHQCWLNKHRTMPIHWALVWNATDGCFEKHDISRVMKNSAVSLGHHGEHCPRAELAHSFTLVDTNGIHATAIRFCGCTTAGEDYQQLLQARIFPGSIKDPKTGYTLGLPEHYHQARNQGKGSAYNFVRVLQRLADPHFKNAVPDIYANFLMVTRYHQYLDILMKRGGAHQPDAPLPGELDRPYPNRAKGYLGMPCGACPEHGINMPLVVTCPSYLRHLISRFYTIDGNFKMNLHFKRGNGTDIALTDGNIGVVACTCEHTVAGSFINMHVGEAFALGTFAVREFLRHNNSPPYPPESATPMVQSYDSQCSFVVNQVKRAIALFPDETWLHELLAVYFACRAHFQGETAEMLWAFLNPLGASLRQSTGPARHDIMNFVVGAWNLEKVLHQADLLAAERQDVLRLFELHMAILVDLSRQHETEIGAWSRLSRLATKGPDGKPRSVYQHESTKVLTIENVLASLIAQEQAQAPQVAALPPLSSVAQWMRDGMDIERQQVLTIAFLKTQREHPLQETSDAITNLRKSLNLTLKKFRDWLTRIYPRLTLSALDAHEPELTAIQLPSYRMKHGQRATEDATNDDSKLRCAEIQLRCAQADNGILTVQAACLALFATKKARKDDFRGQAGVTCSQRNVQKAVLRKEFEIVMYNKVRACLIHLGHMPDDATEPYPPLTARDTRRKETHLHRVTGDSRLFDGTAWYLQAGGTLHTDGAPSPLSPVKRRDENDPGPQLVAGTQALKRAGPAIHSPRAPKRLKDIIPVDAGVDVPSSSLSEAEDSDSELPAKQGMLRQRKGQGKRKNTKPKKGEGWIWLETVTRGQRAGEGRLAEYKAEMAEAEMYRWLEAYERKHAELFRVIARFRRDSVVWTGRADREQENGAVCFARMQAAMYQRLQHNAEEIFKSPESGAHHDWVKAASFDELVTKVDSWCDKVFTWMDQMGIHRVYKDF